MIGAGQRSAIATLFERKTRHTILVPVRFGHSAKNMGDALIATFKRLPSVLRRTLTWDQGNEMFHHERIERTIEVRIFFADPHSPWQRGSNENTDCSANTSPEEPTSTPLPTGIYNTSPNNSTTDPEPVSTIALRGIS